MAPRARNLSGTGAVVHTKNKLSRGSGGSWPQEENKEHEEIGEDIAG